MELLDMTNQNTANIRFSDGYGDRPPRRIELEVGAYLVERCYGQTFNILRKMIYLFCPSIVISKIML